MTHLLPAFAGTVIIYFFLIAGIRTFGRRQMGQLTPLDFLIILLLGSAVETSLIGPAHKPPDEVGFHDPNVSLTAGLVSAATLLLLNKGMSFLLCRNKKLRHLVVGGPVILVHCGHIVEEHLKRAGLTEGDLMEAMRVRGYASVSEVRFAVLEPNGELHIVPMGSAKQKQQCSLSSPGGGG